MIKCRHAMYLVASVLILILAERFLRKLLLHGTPQTEFLSTSATQGELESMSGQSVLMHPKAAKSEETQASPSNRARSSPPISPENNTPPGRKSCLEQEQGLVKGVNDILKHLTLDKLREAKTLRSLVREVGLVWDARPIYGKESQYQIHPHAVKKGLQSDNLRTGNRSYYGMYQQPHQISCALEYLSSKNIRTFLEVGVFAGWTGLFMSAYLRRFVPEGSFMSRGVDIEDFRSDCTRALATEIGHTFFKKKPYNTSYTNFDEEALRGMPPIIDLCFIDGDHSYDGVHADVIWLQKRCRYLMLHDVFDIDCPGVVKQWLELKKTGEYFECIKQPARLPASQWKVSLGRTIARLGIGISRTAVA